MTRYVLTCLILFSVSFLSVAQIKIRVIDASSQTAIEGAEIRSAKDKKIIYTDNKGYFTLDHADSVMISKSGYSEQLREIAANTIVKLEPTTNFLTEVVVSANRTQQQRKEIPAAISKISSAVIAETKATALYQLLNKNAGVYMVNLGNEQHTMAIRQPITYNALYLYLEDGLPIRPTGIFNHNALYEINMNGLKSIEVLKGPASSLYGSNAIGGSVNFITASPPAGSSAGISVQGDRYNYYRSDLNTGFSSGKVGVYFGGYVAQQKNSWQDYSNFDKYSANIKTTYDLSSSSRLSISGSYNYLYTQTPGSVDSAHFYSRSYASNNRFTYREVKAFRLSTRMDHTWNSNNSTFFTAFFRDNSTGQLPSYRLGYVGATATKAYGEENNQSFNSYGFLVQHKANFGFLHSQLTGGIYLDNSPSSYYSTYLSVARDAQQNYYTSFVNTDSLTNNYKTHLFNTAVFAQYEMNPVKPLHVVASLRYDNIAYRFRNYLPANQTKFKERENNSYNVLAPKLGLTYDFGRGYGMYANTSLGFQPPETSVLYSSSQQTKLKKASFYNFEAGGWLPLIPGRLNAELAVFDMLGTNEIISVMMPDNTTQYDNAGKTGHMGFEYTLHFTPIQEIGFRLSGTLVKHKYIKYSELVSGVNKNYDGNRMPNAPTSIINSEISYKPRFLKGLRSSVEWQYLSKYYVNSANTKTYSGYDIFNVRLGYDVKTGVAKGAGLWLNVMNVTNQLYSSVVTGTQYGVTYNADPPRIFALGLSYSLSQIK